eukprot:TRINITY_DN15827_c0_g1::TRINITY_DN15827_c0_g1_i1::g.22587::m.22587 TRINITY_DN15827_c0_g1::TRINITY_DN15827_c0_g1_i1::g.22587  ORF type:complete len:374 (-),score=27.45,sp/Q9JI19/FIBP_MOUSE/32.69/2e-56,FIBP/PF05427.6/1.9e-73 TRINITY_DN15827_c0_g1_i1:119-1240(-)
MADVEARFCVFVGEPILFDVECYNCWLAGLPVQAAASQRMKTIPDLRQFLIDKESETYHSALQMVQDDTLDHYRTYDQLEHYLSEPRLFLSQTVFDLPLQVRRIIIERFYGFEDRLMKEFLAKKLSSKVRKELEDIGDKHGVRLQSCKRQFENARRIVKYLKDIDFQPLLKTIESIFCISPELCARYARITFLWFHRFEIQRKKVQFLEYSDLDHFAATMMVNWTDGASVELDPIFLDDTHSIKGLLSERDLVDSYRTLVRQRFTLESDRSQRLDNKFSSILRVLLNLSADLSKAKELKDFTVDIVEKIGEKFVSLPFRKDEVAQFFKALYEAFTELEPPALKRYQNSWLRFLNGVLACLLPIYNRIVNIYRD